MKFDNVLVPIDGSFLSEVVVDLALHSAGTFATHLTFLYVIDPAQAHRFGEIDENAALFHMKIEGNVYLDMASKKAKDAGVDFECQLVQGTPWKVISEMSKEQDMVIMGIAGKTGFGQGRIGETAAKSIENSYCPVLTLKSGSRQIKEVLLPVANKNMQAIDVAIETVKRVDGTLTVFAVRSKDVSPDDLVEEVAAKCREAGINVKTQIGEGDPAEAISGLSGMYDLVVMGTEGRQGLKKVLNGSVAERVVINASCPVTIVRDI
jgi:nucleotide-binding universal stress UspA family protein